MAHFARIDENNVVIQVIVIDNKSLGDLEFPDSEYAGQKYIKNVIGLPGTWMQTSYNRNFRKNFAGRGSVYDKGRDAFIQPKPYDSWKLDEETCKWEPPTPMPSRDALYDWDEETQQWIEFEDYDVE